MVNSKKRIYNYMDKLFLGDGYIGGVCDGLGKWSGIPPILWRIGFLFIFPYAFCIYLILWVTLKKHI